MRRLQTRYRWRRHLTQAITSDRFVSMGILRLCIRCLGLRVVAPRCGSDAISQHCFDRWGNDILFVSKALASTLPRRSL